MFGFLVVGFVLLLVVLGGCFFLVLVVMVVVGLFGVFWVVVFLFWCVFGVFFLVVGFLFYFLFLVWLWVGLCLGVWGLLLLVWVYFVDCCLFVVWGRFLVFGFVFCCVFLVCVGCFCFGSYKCVSFTLCFWLMVCVGMVFVYVNSLYVWFMFGFNVIWRSFSFLICILSSLLAFGGISVALVKEFCYALNSCFLRIYSLLGVGVYPDAVF